MNLEIGSGNNPQPGYVHTDRYLDHKHPCLPDVCCDASDLPFRNDIFDSVLMFGVFEHFGIFEIQIVVHEVVRVLRKGGTFKVDVPDFDWFVGHYLEIRNEPLDPVRTKEWIMHAIFGGQEAPGMFHKWAWNETRLRKFLEKPNWAFSTVSLVGRKWRDPEANHLIWECVK